MFKCSGGRLSVIAWLSPMSSRSLLFAHNSPVDGLKASPTELRSPVAKVCGFEPSRLSRVTAALGSGSSHTLHDEPTATYIRLSGPNTTVRVLWPPLGIPDTSVTGVVVT